MGTGSLMSTHQSPNRPTHEIVNHDGNLRSMHQRVIQIGDRVKRIGVCLGQMEFRRLLLLTRYFNPNGLIFTDAMEYKIIQINGSRIIFSIRPMLPTNSQRIIGCKKASIYFLRDWIVKGVPFSRDQGTARIAYGLKIT